MQTLNVETIKLIGNGVLNANDVAALLQANMLAEAAALDPLQQARVCAVVSDAEELLLKGDPDERKRLAEQGIREPMGIADFALEEAKALYPERYADGKHFEHMGGKFCVESKSKLRLTDENGNPLKGTVYTQIRAIDKRKKELTSEQSRLTRQRADIVDAFAQEHPKMAKFDTTYTLKVIRAKS